MAFTPQILLRDSRATFDIQCRPEGSRYARKEPREEEGG
jgi:hypothetical protein